MSGFSREEVLKILLEHADFTEIEQEHPGLDRTHAKRMLFPGVREVSSGNGGAFDLWTDGASRGNPGEAGIGIVMRNGSEPLYLECCRYLGRATNNEAEYSALITGLREVLKYKPDSVTVHMDSELVVRQIGGKYRVKNSRLQILHREALDLLSEINVWEVRHVPRSENSAADELANYAIDEKPGGLYCRKKSAGDDERT